MGDILHPFQAKRFQLRYKLPEVIQKILIELHDDKQIMPTFSLILLLKQTRFRLMCGNHCGVVYGNHFTHVYHIVGSQVFVVCAWQPLHYQYMYIIRLDHTSVGFIFFSKECLECMMTGYMKHYVDNEVTTI